MPRPLLTLRRVVIMASIVGCVLGLASVAVGYREHGRVDWAHLVEALCAPLATVSLLSYAAQAGTSARDRTRTGA